MSPHLSVRSWLSRRSRALVPLVMTAALAVSAVLAVHSLSGSTPDRAHAAGAPRAYVGLFKENAVAVLDVSSNTVVKKIPVPAGPHGLVATPDGGKVYVSSDGDSTVSVLDTATDSVAQTVQVGKSPHGLAMTPDGKLVLVGVWDGNQLAFLDTTTDQVVRQTPVVNPHNMAVTPDGTFVYVGSQEQGAPALVKVRVSSGEIVGRLPLDGTPRGLSVVPDGSSVYVTRAGQEDVLVVDTATDQPVGKIAVGPSPHLPSFASGALALVNVQGKDQLDTIDPASQRVLGTVTVGKMPHWTATTSDGTLAFETNEGSNDVSVVDLATMSVRATVPVGEAPRKIVLLPGITSASVAAPSAAPAPQARPSAPSSSTASAATAGDVQVSIKNMSFGDPITVNVGQRVTWVNGDSVTHTVTAQDESWDSDDLAPGAQFSKTFDAPGEYAYYCEFHPHMRGRVVVR